MYSVYTYIHTYIDIRVETVIERSSNSLVCLQLHLRDDLWQKSLHCMILSGRLRLCCRHPSYRSETHPVVNVKRPETPRHAGDRIGTRSDLGCYTSPKCAREDAGSIVDPYLIAVNITYIEALLGEDMLYYTDGAVARMAAITCVCSTRLFM
jgi:hypothetical protein